MFEDAVAKVDRFVTANEWRLINARLRAKLRYKPLAVSHKEPIRLLLLYPGSSGEAIHGKFIGAGLKDPPHYEALSYTWGNPFANPYAVAPIVDLERKSVQQYRSWFNLENQHSIYVNGRVIEIGQNLFDALRHIRDERRKILLWVDALCINQEDDDEKRHQISIMNSIYRNAKRVHVWLGPENIHIPAVEGETSSKYQWSEDPSSFSQAMLFCRIFTSSWFQRLWIVQEAVVASDLIFRCGAIEITLWDMEAFIESQNKIDRASQGYESVVDNKIINRAIKTLQRISCIRSLVDRVRLDVALFGWRFNICRDRRDRVYALLSLARKADGTLLLEPNYSTPSHELSRQFVVASIRTYGTLDILRYVHHIYDPNKKPTWAFNLDTGVDKDNLGVSVKAGDKNSNNVICSLEPALQHPKRPLPSYFEQDDDPVLLLSGRTVMEIKTIGETVYADVTLGLALTCDWNDSHHPNVRTYLSKEDATRFKSSLSASELLPTDEAYSNFEDEVENEAGSTGSTTFHKEVVQANSDSLLASLLESYRRLTLNWAITLPKYDQVPDPAATVFERSINARFPREMLIGRRLALTDKLMHAIVPRETEPGDVIVMLSHSRNPFVVRPYGVRSRPVAAANIATDVSREDKRDAGVINDDEKKYGLDFGHSSSSRVFQSATDEKTTAGKVNAYTLVGPCYLQERLDWEAFEQLPLDELEELLLY